MKEARALELAYLALAFSLNESFLLQRLAVNLINANEAPDEIPIFLISKSTSAGEPGKLTRRFRMIRIVDDISLNGTIAG